MFINCDLHVASSDNRTVNIPDSTLVSVHVRIHVYVSLSLSLSFFLVAEQTVNYTRDCGLG